MSSQAFYFKNLQYEKVKDEMQSKFNYWKPKLEKPSVSWLDSFIKNNGLT